MILTHMSLRREPLHLLLLAKAKARVKTKAKAKNLRKVKARKASQIAGLGKIGEIDPGAAHGMHPIADGTFMTLGHGTPGAAVSQALIDESR